MKYLKIGLITLGIIFITWILYSTITSIKSQKIFEKEIKELRKTTKITYKEKDINIENKEKLIDIIERSSDEGPFFINLPTFQNIEKIYFYNDEDKIINTLLFYPDYFYIGFKDIEREILEKDRDTFKEILEDTMEYNEKDQ